MAADISPNGVENKSVPVSPISGRSGEGALDGALDGAHVYTLRELARDDTLSQRDLAGRLGVSLGRVNYVVNSLIDRGLLKARRFKNSRNKLAYRYILTPAGISEKVKVTRRFLAVKMHEFERLQREIEELRRDSGDEGEGTER